MVCKKIILSALLLLLASCVRMPVPKENTPLRISRPTETVPVFIIADSLHTQIAFPYDWLRESGYIFPKNFQAPRSWQNRCNYVVMSWGDRTAFVQKRWLYPWEVFYALFLPSPAVTEIVSVPYYVEKVCLSQRVYQGHVPRSAGKNLAHFLNQTNLLDQNGMPKIRQESTWGNGFLIDSKYPYYFPRICNVWSAQCLEACGMNINIAHALSANGLITQCEKNGFQKISNGTHE